MAEQPIRLSSDEFERVVSQAIDRIPEELRGHLVNLVISVQPRPSGELLAEMGFAPDEELFGIFTGVPLTERSVTDPPLYPDTIQIFQEPLEAYCLDLEELIEEIEITVVHEIAHFLGFDDDQLEALGYG
ncbi:MAG TPA: metallopeptidase family protein [Desulforhopalus sp.]|nr:metallopeptidase family protein [Desulforhopalus sp.]